MKRYLFAFGAALAFVATVGATYQYDSNHVNRAVFQSTYTSFPSCTYAISAGEVCIEGDLESLANVYGVNGTFSGTLTAGTMSTIVGAVATNGGSTWTKTSIDFTRAHEVAIFAKNTGAIKTAVNAQQDFMYAGAPGPSYYLELAQGVGAKGADTLLASAGFTATAQGWLVPLDNTATDSIEITEGIVAGSAHSFVSGTDTAKCKAVISVGTGANFTHVGFGLRKLAVYETASTAAEWKAAYDEKAMIGFIGSSAYVTETSKAGSDTETTLAHAAFTDGNLMALEVDMAATGAVTYKLGEATPAGTTYAQMQTAITAALAALAADASAVAYTPTAASVLVPSFIFGASGSGVTDARLVYFQCGAS